MLKIEHLFKRFQNRTVVNDLNITLSKGELYCFLGPNGAGKTTTLKMVTGLLKPDSGKIIINGHDLFSETMAAKRSFGYIPDQPHLFDRLTPFEFLKFICYLYDMDSNSCLKSINEWLELFNLQDFQNELLGTFSHGMRQKVAFISALIHSPPILIIDEPMVGLDPQGAVQLKEILKHRCQKGLTAMVSTHSLEIAEDLADRIGIIFKGRLIAEGTLSDLRELSRSEKGDLRSIFLKLTNDDETSLPTLIAEKQ